jgi:predicted Zn-dependent protease
VGLLVSDSPEASSERLQEFTEQMVSDIVDELTSATDLPWRFHPVEVDSLPDGRVRRPSAFVDDASLRVAEGPYDLIVVVTDVPLISHRKQSVAGLPSPISRTVVVSTHKLLIGMRDSGRRSLDSQVVRTNAATLLLHLIGHVLGADHNSKGGVMKPFRFDPDLESIPAFRPGDTRDLRRLALRFPDKTVSRGRFRRLVFHATSLRQNPWEIGRAVAGSRGLLLPFALPKLATAAVTPTLILVFSAETWDVGLHLGNSVATVFASLSILAAAIHLMFTQNLFFPRQPGQTLTEHMALVNVTVFLILLLGMVGLFLLVGTIILFIEMLVFPPNLMTNWPSLENPVVGPVDLVRTAVFISTLGVLSGALAGGVENRTLISHLALFRDRP